MAEKSNASDISPPSQQQLQNHGLPIAQRARIAQFTNPQAAPAPASASASASPSFIPKKNKPPIFDGNHPQIL
jgi:hypothetical protein